MLADAHAWATAAGVVGVAWAIAACYIAWRLTGGKHLGDPDEHTKETKRKPNFGPPD